MDEQSHAGAGAWVPPGGSSRGRSELCGWKALGTRASLLSYTASSPLRCCPQRLRQPSPAAPYRDSQPGQPPPLQVVSPACVHLCVCVWCARAQPSSADGLNSLFSSRLLPDKGRPSFRCLLAAPGAELPALPSTGPARQLFCHQEREDGSGHERGGPGVGRHPSHGGEGTL